MASNKQYLQSPSTTVDGAASAHRVPAIGCGNPGLHARRIASCGGAADCCDDGPFVSLPTTWAEAPPECTPLKAQGVVTKGSGRKATPAAQATTARTISRANGGSIGAWTSKRHTSLPRSPAGCPNQMQWQRCRECSWIPQGERDSRPSICPGWGGTAACVLVLCVGMMG
jgi:hypothetical protein